MFNLPSINSEEEVLKIESFIKGTFTKQKINKAVIGVSGGIDSAVSLFLLSRSLPLDNIYVLHLPYFENHSKDIEEIIRAVNLPEKNYRNISIKNMADKIFDELQISPTDLIRRGNIMARIRMITLFDFAKKENGLVVGTENKSESHLGYFTRFGDGASDVEPIMHLYKGQVYDLAKYLGVPKSVLDKPPSANLWEDQADEKEFGFSYAEADPVLYLFFEEKKSLDEIEKDFPNARKIIDFVNKNSYKHYVPYSLA